MAETSVKYKAVADVRDLKAWTAAVIDGARALDKMTDAERRHTTTTDGGGGGGGGMDGGGGGGAALPPAPAPSPVSPSAPPWTPSWTTPGAPWHTPPTVPTSPTPTPAPAPSPVSPGAGAQPGGGAAPASPFMNRVRSGVTAGLGMGVGMALGGSALGFIMSAGEQFMEVDRILGQLQQRFGQSAGIRKFGADLGYTVEQAAELATVLGATEDTFSGRLARRYTGFARVRGLDPSQTVGQLATIGRVSGGPLSNQALSGILGGAASVGMGRGRLGEYLDVLSQMMQQQQAVMGVGDIGAQQRTLGMISRAYGGSDAGTGRNAQDIAGRLQGVMTGGGLDVFLMRAMGYGRDPKIDYIEMRKRREAGLNDPRNLALLFEEYQKRGYGRQNMFRALESVAGGALSASQIDRLVGELGTPEGLDAYRKGEVPLAMAGTDFAAAGARTVRRGEARAVQLEAMKLDVGDTVSQMMGDMTEAARNMMKASENVFGGGIGDAATGLTDAVVTLTGWIEQATKLLGDMYTWATGRSPTNTVPMRAEDAAAAPTPGQRPPAGARER